MHAIFVISKLSTSRSDARARKGVSFYFLLAVFQFFCIPTVHLYKSNGCSGFRTRTGIKVTRILILLDLDVTSLTPLNIPFF